MNSKTFNNSSNNFPLLKNKSKLFPNITGIEKFISYALKIITLKRIRDNGKIFLPQNAIVASLLLSIGGAQYLHIPWHAGYVTPCYDESNL